MTKTVDWRFDLNVVPGFKDTPTGHDFQRANEIADKRHMKNATLALREAMAERLGVEAVASLEQRVREL